MGAFALEAVRTPREEEVTEYLSGYWMETDLWELEAAAFKISRIDTRSKKGVLADFSSYKSFTLKNEMKFYLLHALKEKIISVTNIYHHYRSVIKKIGTYQTASSFDQAEIIDLHVESPEQKRLSEIMQRNVIRFITDFYDERPELEKDKWHAQLIPGVKLSAAIKRQKPSLSFEGIPDYYKESTKRYMKSLIYRRSWSFCTEVLVYIRYFYKSFYDHNYPDGFQEALTRKDIESYLGWVAEDYEHSNATLRSKAISFIRNWLDFIQLAEF